MTTTYRFKLRHDTAANWTTVNPVLLAGEPGVETDTDLFKFGDGVTVWTALDYANEDAGTAALAAHEADTTSIHGIANTALLETTAGATSKAAAAQAAAIAASQPLATVLTNTTAAFTTAQETKLAGVEAAATADMTAAEILTAIKTVDGAGSGLDADLLDGVSAAGFDVAGAAAAAQAASQPVATVLTNTTASFLTADETKLDGIATGAQVNDTAAQILTKLLTVDGSGSGLDADLLDGNSSATFATATGLSDHLADTTAAHAATAIAFTPAGTIAATTVQAAIEEVASEAGGGGVTNLAYTAATGNGIVTSDTGTDATLTVADGTNAGLMAPAGFTKLAGIEAGATADQTAAEILAALLTVDGASSGLDADLLDGTSSAGFATAAHNHTGTYQPLATVLTNTTASFLTADETKLDGIEALAEVNDTAAEILTKLLTVDGTGSGLDADLLDGSSSAAFAGAGHDHAGVYQPADGDLTALAAISGVQGDVIYHNGTSWVRLGAGTATHVLTTGGAGANPAWAAASGGGSSTNGQAVLSPMILGA